MNHRQSLNIFRIASENKENLPKTLMSEQLIALSILRANTTSLIQDINSFEHTSFCEVILN